MSSIPVISTDESINSRIHSFIMRDYPNETPVFLSNKEEVLEYLKYELPELVVYNLSDENIPIREILTEVLSDSWLLYGGIIGIFAPPIRVEFEEYLKQFNVIAMIPNYEFDFSFPRAFRIIQQNRAILFHRDLYNKLFDALSGSFVIDNDPFDVRTYANLLTNYLYNADFIDGDLRDRLQVALMELLMNAVEHGNCRISYDEKSEWLETHGDIFELVRRKNRISEISARKIRFHYRISTEDSRFRICDDGDGFDWRGMMEGGGDEPNLGKHGHGIKMSSHYMGGLSYNEKGNCVSFAISHQQNAVNTVPGILEGARERIFEDGELVFSENEDSNYLYYIVSGSFRVSSHGQTAFGTDPGRHVCR